MASLMCVDLDLASDTGFVSGSLPESNSEMSVGAILEREVSEATENHDGVVRWLELDELGIDDDILVSLDLPRKFPVYRSFLFTTSTFCNSLSNLHVLLFRPQMLTYCCHNSKRWQD